MHLFTVTSILVVAAGLCHAQADDSATNADNHWCGNWAGSPKPEDVPTAGQLPNLDYQRRQFIEPQLQRTPFSPVMASEEKVQIPKIWGNNEFRLALLSYTDQHKRIYASSKSTWADFGKGVNLVMDNCVSKGTGGAYLVPPTPGLTQSSLVVYAYAVGSYFDYQMNIYMSQPYGINPALIGQNFLTAGSNMSDVVPTAIA